jgi:DNA-binding response OmpR family regulator
MKPGGKMPMEANKATMQTSVTTSTAEAPQVAATHVAIVEDDETVLDVLRIAFEDAGFRVSLARNGAELKAIIAAGAVHLISLDLGLPNEDGIDLARDICARHDIPLIIVTGRTKKISKIVGLEVGADDYIVKPFDLDELIARARAILRRSRRAVPAIPDCANAGAACVTFDRWRYDIRGYRLWTPASEVVELTSSELDLLTIFVRHPRTPLSRARIAEKLRGSADAAAERSIDVLVGRLRRKLERYAEGQELIRTVRGEGYLFASEVIPS